MEIIPSILATTEEQFKKNLMGIGTAVNIVQIDIADGKFVPNVTAATSELADKYLTIDCELHLMVKNPGEYLSDWSTIPQVKRVFVHVDCGADIDEVIKIIHSHGWQAGLVLNPKTPNANVEPFLARVQAVMFMGVHPGKQGGEFLPEVLQKVTEFKILHPKMWIEWDGGVNEKTLPAIIKTGIDAVCPGSAIFGNEKTPIENIKTIQKIIKICST